MADLPVALGNLERAFAELESYIARPVPHQRDKAGLIPPDREYGVTAPSLAGASQEARLQGASTSRVMQS
jgi:hypothetical protein